MGMVFLVLEYLLITLLVLLIMILFIPVVYTLNGIKNEYYFFSFRVSWLWKIFSIIIKKEENQAVDTCIVIFGFRISINHIGKKKERMKNRRKEKQKKLKRDIKYFSLFHQSFLTPLFKFLRRLFRHVLPRKYRFHLIYGCADAADTGMLSGFIAMLWPYIPHDDIVIRPVFDEEVIRGELNLEGRIIIAVILYYFLQFYFTKDIRQMIRKIRTK